MNMTANRTAVVKDIIEHISKGARDALHRAGRMASAEDISNDEFKALAKEVEEVGELVHQLDNINPIIVPVLFEVPSGKWRGWSGLVNYRNTLAHRFRKITCGELIDHVLNKLALQEVADLLEAVTSVGMNEAYSFGVESDIKRLPRSSTQDDLLPGSSLIVLRFTQEGELMANRAWRDERDNWRASTRYIWTKEEDDNRIFLVIRDTEMLLTPRSMESDDCGKEHAYNLLSVPPQPYCWDLKVLRQIDSYPVVEKRRS